MSAPLKRNSAAVKKKLWRDAQGCWWRAHPLHGTWQINLSMEGDGEWSDCDLMPDDLPLTEVSAGGTE